MFAISCLRNANCNFILRYMQTQEDFVHHISWNNFRIKRKACWENTTVRVTPGNKFVLEDYCLCFLRYVCCRRNASNRCFSAGPLITFQWKDFSQTCLNPRNSCYKDLLKDALTRLCTKAGGETKRVEHRRGFEDQRGKDEEQVTLSVDKLYSKIADSVDPIRTKVPNISIEVKNRKTRCFR